ncbi:hypothetical protein XELAEV_18022564mg [Xenopus laevis]|uniref:Uncharacterized protein n=1 Tax=Xenopus laevis TaxID=8355 RepID=A0A974HNI6_XENLA|nr:hypothetical protein XELAEV_18022564mg [Xenopus laevis]
MTFGILLSAGVVNSQEGGGNVEVGRPWNGVGVPLGIHMVHILLLGMGRSPLNGGQLMRGFLALASKCLQEKPNIYFDN